MRRLKYRARAMEGGFTIVELLIASAVFSIVMMTALSGFAEIGRLFFKASINTASQRATQHIIDQVAGDIHSSNHVYGPFVTGSGGNKRFYCIGNARYTFIVGKQYQADTANRTDNFGILRDELNGAVGCANPFDGTQVVPIDSTASELIGDRMRLNAFCIAYNTSTPGILFDVQVDLATGNDSNLRFNSQNVGDCGASQAADCNSELRVSQYCARSNVSTSIAGSSGRLFSDATIPDSGVTYTLTVTAQTLRNGDYIDGNGIDCGQASGSLPHNICSKSIPIGTNVTLKAHPSSNTNFDKWTGDCVTATGSTCTLTMLSNSNVTGSFVLAP